MTGIQIVLVLAAAIWIARFLRGASGSNIARVLALAAAAAGVALTLAPELSTRLARILGVTRGADLVLYLSIVALGFLWLQQTARVRQLELKLDLLVRRLALEESNHRESGVRNDRETPGGRQGAD